MENVRVMAGMRRVEGSTMRMMTLGVATVVLAVAGITAQAQGHHGGGPGGHRGGGEMMFGGSPEQVGRMVDRMLDGLDATEAQRTQVKQIAVAAASDLRAQRDSDRGLREQGMRLFAAPTVDANAAESIRQQMSAQHDQASKRMLQAMLDVSRVLTPEQRVKAGERMAQRQSAMKERMERMREQRPMRGPAGASQPAPQR